MGAESLYAGVAYARAFGGAVVDVPEWGTALLRRLIPGTELEDAIGCYPLSAIEQKADVTAGLMRLQSEKLVSVALVPDPVTGPSPETLMAAFPVCRPFKRHYLIDRAAGEMRLSATHRRWMRKAMRDCQIGIVSLLDSLGDWMRLYRGTIERHGITGLQRFSRDYFAALGRLSSVVAFAASRREKIVAMALWVDDGDVVYYHLGASDSRGYQAQAMYGIFAAVQEYFSAARILHLGGAAGLAPEDSDGLARFKRGFANREVEAYFCGAILDQEHYAALGQGNRADFFPVYREP